MKKISADTVIKKNEDILVKKIDKEAVLLNLATGDYFTLNETLRVIWSLIDGKLTLQEMALKMVSSYDVGYRRALSDIISLVGKLQKRKLIAID